MTREEASDFARRWVEAWNARDVEHHLSHCDDAVRFTSPRALATVGSATLSGKDALRTYWLARMGQVETLHFALDHVVWDGERSELVIVYENTVNGQRNRACELMQFDRAGQMVRGEAMYGAPL